MNNKEMLSENKQWILAIILIFLVLMVYVKFLLGPAIGEIRSLHSEMRERKQSLTTVRRAIPRLSQMEAEIIHLRQKAKELKGRFPSRSELPALLEHLSEVAEKSDVRIIEISPSSPVQAGQTSSVIYEELPIAITAKSGYHGLGSFINQLENSERLFMVGDIRIQSDPNDQKRHHVELLVETFVRQMGNP